MFRASHTPNPGHFDKVFEINAGTPCTEWMKRWARFLESSGWENIRYSNRFLRASEDCLVDMIVLAAQGACFERYIREKCQAKCDSMSEGSCRCDLIELSALRTELDLDLFQNSARCSTTSEWCRAFEAALSTSSGDPEELYAKLHFAKNSMREMIEHGLKDAARILGVDPKLSVRVIVPCRRGVSGDVKHEFSVIGDVMEERFEFEVPKCVEDYCVKIKRTMLMSRIAAESERSKVQERKIVDMAKEFGRKLKALKVSDSSRRAAVRPIPVAPYRSSLFSGLDLTHGESRPWPYDGELDLDAGMSSWWTAASQKAPSLKRGRKGEGVRPVVARADKSASMRRKVHVRRSGAGGGLSSVDPPVPPPMAARRHQDEESTDWWRGSVDSKTTMQRPAKMRRTGKPDLESRFDAPAVPRPDDSVLDISLDSEEDDGPESSSDVPEDDDEEEEDSMDEGL